MKHNRFELGIRVLILLIRKPRAMQDMLFHHSLPRVMVRNFLYKVLLKFKQSLNYDLGYNECVNKGKKEASERNQASIVPFTFTNH